MENIQVRMKRQSQKKLRFENGRIYFSRAAERKLFFGLTLIMLLLGILFKLGVW
jgi:hypothetical protein